MTFATWDSGQLSNATLSGGDLIATASGVGGVRGQGTNRTGKWYWETTLTTLATSARLGIGWANTPPSTFNSTSNNAATLTAAGDISVNGSGTVTVGGVSTSVSFGARASGDLICIAVDLDAGLLWFRVGAAGNWNNNAARNPATGAGGVSIASVVSGPAYDWYPFVGMGATGGVWTANFGASAFTGTVPSGFTSGWTTASAVTNAVSSRAGIETWFVGQGTANISRVGYEAWFSIVPQAVVTCTGREVWFPVYTGGAPSLRKNRVCIISSE